MKKLLLSISMILFASSAFAETMPNEEPKEILKALELKSTDMFEGNKDAPIKVVEYASMTCGHCAHFHNSYYEKIKEKFIDTGKVRFVFRELPWDNRAMAVSIIARCAPKEDYFNFISAFMSTANNWVRSDDFISSIKQIARLGGMTPSKVDSCLRDEKINRLVRKSYNDATKLLKVQGTPTFFINGRRYSGVMTTDEFSKVIKNLEKLGASN